MNSNYRCNGIFVSQQMEAGHVATHMIFHAITADQNARIRILHRGSAGKSRRFAPNVTTAKTKQEDRHIGYYM